MSNLEEQSGTLLGQSEGLTEEQQALIQAFVGMVKRGEVPTTQGGNETNQGARGNSTEANDPMETNEGEDDENGSLKVELLHGIRAEGDREETVRRVTRVRAPTMAGSGPLSGHKRPNDDDDARSQLSLPNSHVSIGGYESFGRIKVDSMKVPKYNGADFNNWRINMEMFLEAAEVWDLVSGELPEPIVTEDGTVLIGRSLDVEGTEADIKEWRKRNFYACTILYGGMSTEMQRSVAHLKRDSVKIWRRLQDLYQRKAPLNRMYLQQEWKEFAMGSNWTMKRYVVQYQELVERMKAYDLHMSEEALVNQFLLGLTREYDVDRKLLCAREGLSLEEATNILLSESIAREIQKGRGHGSRDRPTDPAANIAGGTRSEGATRGGKSNRGGANRGGRGGGRTTNGRSSTSGDKSTCYTCGQSGHWSRDCTHRTDTVLKVCYHCKKPDHVLADCPANTGGARKNNASSSMATGEESPSLNED